MRRLLVSLTAAAVILTAPVTPSAAAEPIENTPPSSSSPDGYTYFTGQWRVTSRDAQGGNPVVVAYNVEPVLGGRWLAGSARSDDPTVASRDVWGRDPRSGEIVRTIFDVSGTWAVVRSPGWRGNMLILEGDATSSGGVLRVRETITRAGPNSFTAVWEARREQTWIPYALEQIERVAG